MSTSACADSRSLWEARAAKLASDPSVIRFYGFQEGVGDLVANTAGKGEGAMLMVGYSPYGLYRGLPRWPAPLPAECPHWSAGRWPWKHALACGDASPQLVRSHLHATPAGAFTVEAWVRPHPLGEAEWVHGNLLALGTAFGNGWSIAATRDKWCKDGFACFRIGVPAGAVSTPFNPDSATDAYVPFTFGSWHHLVAVWDGKAIRLHVDGKIRSAATPGPNPPPPQPKVEPENDIDGLVVGGKLRFDIDELVIYDRALSTAEIDDNYAKFLPPAEAAAVPAPIVFEFPKQTGGYFPVGKPITAVVRARPGDTAKCIVKPRSGGAALFEKESKLEEGTPAKFAFTPAQCGLFDVDLSVRDTAGEVLQREIFPVGVVSPVHGDAGLGSRHSGAAQPWAPSLGITWDQVLVDWQRAEPKKGIYDWSLTDQMMETASGLKTICCVVGWPSWLGTNTADMGVWRNFLDLLARRYHQNVAAYECRTWDYNSGARTEAFPGSKEDFAKFSLSAAEALGGPLVNQGGLRTTRFGFRQPAAPMGDFDPGDFDSPIYSKRLQGTGGDRQVKIGPWPLFPARRSAVLQVWKVLESHAAGTDVAVLECPPDEYYPAWNGSDGTPSEQGVALAALTSALAGASSVQELSAPEALRMFRITGPGAKIITVLGLRNPENLKVRLAAAGKIKARDWQGNPVGFLPDTIPLNEFPLYLLAKIEPAQLDLLK
ncbi:MAG: LamG domain-containing protein [Terrimicrobiaceae bacterium]